MSAKSYDNIIKEITVELAVSQSSLNNAAMLLQELQKAHPSVAPRKRVKNFNPDIQALAKKVHQKRQLKTKEAA